MFGPDSSQPRGFAPSTNPLHPFDVAAKPMPDSPLGLVPLQGSLQVVVVPTPPAEACCAAGTSTLSAVRRLLPLLPSSSSYCPPKCAVLAVPPDPAAHRSVLLCRAPFDQPLLNFHPLLASPPKCRCLHRPCSPETCPSTHWLFFYSRPGIVVVCTEVPPPTAPRNAPQHRSAAPPLPNRSPVAPRPHRRSDGATIPRTAPPFLPHLNATERRRSLSAEANGASRPHRSATESTATHFLAEAKL